MDIINQSELTENEIAKIKFSLSSTGITINEKLHDLFNLERGEGVHGGIEVKIFNNIHLYILLYSKKEYLTPYELIKVDNCFYIKYDNYNIPLEIIYNNQLDKNYTNNDIPYNKIARLSNDRLNISVLKGCIYNNNNKLACQFCDIAKKKDLYFNSIEDIREVIKFCKKNHNKKIKHILITGGALPDSKLFKYIDVLKCIKSEWNINVYLMMTPPKDFKILKQLYNEGLDEIAFNLEFWDRTIAKKIMPGKGKIEKESYFNAYKYATKLWGKDGNVRSVIIVGVEPLENTLIAVEEISKVGVMPILSPFKPVKDTKMENHTTINSEEMLNIWRDASLIAKKNNIHLGPKCISCQNNTITIPAGSFYEYY